jgi:hypothetical protein
MNNPKTQLLVKGVIVGDIKLQITGYYHYDNIIDKHFICDERLCKRYEIYPETVKLINQ